LDLKQYLDDDLINNKNMSYKYRVFALINHDGNEEKGHYYSYINIDNDFYQFNDLIVKKEIESDLLDNNHSYIIYYEKI